MRAIVKHRQEEQQKKLEQTVTLNGVPQTIRTDKGTAFTGNELITL